MKQMMTNDEKRIVLLLANYIETLWIEFRIFMLTWGFIPMGIMVFSIIGYMLYDFVIHPPALTLLLFLRIMLIGIVFYYYLDHAVSQIMLLLQSMKNNQEAGNN